MTSKEKVLKVYPDAQVVRSMHSSPRDDMWHIYPTASARLPLLSAAPSEAEAWDDAASKLPSAPGPAGETAKRTVRLPDAVLAYMDRELGVPEPVSTDGAAELLPLECVVCDQAIGPLYPVGADCAGWICDECMSHIDDPSAPIAPAAVPESTELLPCPFCGTVPRIGYDGTAYFIRCGQHGCATCPSVSMWEKEDTIAAWNTRTPAASPVAGVSEMPDADRELYLAIAAVPPEVRTKPEAMFKKYADLLFQLAKPSAEGDGWIADGVALIAAERERQIESEGWTPEHDAKHDGNQIAMAAACYASPVPLRAKTEVACGCRTAECPHSAFGKQAWIDAWPWESAWDKRNKHNRMRQLAIAGALIAAEIDRLKRLPAPPLGQGEKR